MTAHIFDIDGTIVHYHTHEWLPGAKKMIRQLAERGDQIIFVTMRGPQDEGTAWSIEKTRSLLDELGVKYRVLFGVQSPRIIYDDNPCEVISREFNQEWK